ncbi:MAG: TMEM165/GDT1 family protein [Gloeomargarita sp. GMQP_bins_120]
MTPDTPRFKIALGSFVTVLLAELGDKTQVTTLLMTGSSHQPGVVFAGAALALLTTSCLGVLVGHWLSQWLPPRRVELVSGVFFVLVGLWLAWDWWRTSRL